MTDLVDVEEGPKKSKPRESAFLSWWLLVVIFCLCLLSTWAVDGFSSRKATRKFEVMWKSESGLSPVRYSMLQLDSVLMYDCEEVDAQKMYDAGWMKVGNLWHGVSEGARWSGKINLLLARRKPDTINGDVNYDGSINIADAVLLIEHLKGGK